MKNKPAGSRFARPNALYKCKSTKLNGRKWCGPHDGYLICRSTWFWWKYLIPQFGPNFSSRENGSSTCTSSSIFKHTPLSKIKTQHRHLRWAEWELVVFRWNPPSDSLLKVFDKPHGRRQNHCVNRERFPEFIYSWYSFNPIKEYICSSNWELSPQGSQNIGNYHL